MGKRSISRVSVAVSPSWTVSRPGLEGLRAAIARTADDLHRMSRAEHLAYWIVPSLFFALALAFYFSGIPWMSGIVCPAQNREWGLLENTQLLILLGILWLCLRRFLSATRGVERGFLALVAMFTAFVFLEEIDYGAHFAQLFTGQRVSALEELTGIYNLHHQGITDKLYKRSAYGLMAVLFLVAPHVARFRRPLLAHLVPAPRIAIVALVALLSDLVPRAIIALELRPDAGLGRNIGEFSEVMVYWVFLVYLVQVLGRPWPASGAGTPLRLA